MLGTKKKKNKLYLFFVIDKHSNKEPVGNNAKWKRERQKNNCETHCQLNETQNT